MHQGVELNSGLTFGGKRLDSLKAGAHWERGTILRDDFARIRMATSHPVETPVEGDVDIDEAVKQILAEIEVEEQDPFEGMAMPSSRRYTTGRSPRTSACLGNSSGSISAIMKPMGMTPQATS